MSYCSHVLSLDEKSPDRIYHDTLYGFPVQDDPELFGRLILEINQAGLSWTTILKKADHFKTAYDGFSIETIAKYDDKDRLRLLNDAGIIRNRLKVDAAIFNAQEVLQLINSYNSFYNWLCHHHPLPLEDWVKLFRKHFKFTGGEITNEFLMSTGFLEGAHRSDCPVYKTIIELNPPWSWTKEQVHE